MKVALVQDKPIFLDRAACIERAMGSISEAVKNGAQLIVFPETFIPGYPAWLWNLRPGVDSRLIELLHVRMVAEAVNLESNDLTPIATAARENSVTIVIGVQEVLPHARHGTLYNTVITIGPDGKILNRHRKIMPTNPERMAWGFGDASGIRVVDTPVGRLGALICWENMHPLARAALYAQGVELYVAPTYDHGPRWLASMCHIAREGGCWVLSCSSAFQAGDITGQIPELAGIFPDEDEWINPGDSCIISPGGREIARPLNKQIGIIYGDIDITRIAAAKRTLDISGHYSRPDLFKLDVRTENQSNKTAY